jgi:hypothetical protein
LDSDCDAEFCFASETLVCRLISAMAAVLINNRTRRKDRIILT